MHPPLSAFAFSLGAYYFYFWLLASEFYRGSLDSSFFASTSYKSPSRLSWSILYLSARAGIWGPTASGTSLRSYGSIKARSVFSWTCCYRCCSSARYSLWCFSSLARLSSARLLCSCKSSCLGDWGTIGATSNRLISKMSLSSGPSIDDTRWSLSSSSSLSTIMSWGSSPRWLGIGSWMVGFWEIWLPRPSGSTAGTKAYWA